jgi:protein involved in polysaccharide export with SLBB domain
MKRIMLSLLVLCAWISPLRGEIKAGDSLQILIRGVPVGEKSKVEGHYVVGRSGSIKVPLADVMVRAQGLTAETLARKIEDVYRKAEIYTHPCIEVLTKAIEGPLPGAEVSVGGHVRRAGPVKFRNGMTLLQAVQAAGDLDPFGSKRRVFVTRGEKRWVADLRSPKGQSFALQSGDTIVVDRRKPFEPN